MKSTKYLGLLLFIFLAINCRKNDDNGPTVTLSSEKKLTSFSFDASSNGALANDITGTIDENTKSISVVVPYGTDVTSLKPTIKISEKSIIDSASAKDFTNSVAYTITAEDKSTATYTVTVQIAPNSMKQIASYHFDRADNPDLDAVITSVIDEAASTIVLYVPNNTDVTNLAPSIEVSSAATYAPMGAQDFTDPVNYTITANDGSQRTYQVKVLPIKVTSFLFSMIDNASLEENVTSIIDQQDNAITVYVPNTATVTALSPNISISGDITSDRSGVQDFTNPVIYEFSAPNGTTESYEVIVIVLQISRFWFSKYIDILGETIIIGEGTIDQNLKEIEVGVSENRDTANLPVPQLLVPNNITISPMGQTNFSNTVNYVLEAPNGVAITYKVVVKKAFKTITNFRFLKGKNPELFSDAVGSIDQENLTIHTVVTLPKFTPLSVLKSLEPTISIQGNDATVDPTGAQDFSKPAPVAYTVTAFDGSSKTYMVTISVLRSE